MMPCSRDITTVDMANYTSSEVLRDGSQIRIAIRADDKQRLLQHFQNLAHSPSTIASLVSSDHTKR